MEIKSENYISNSINKIEIKDIQVSAEVNETYSVFTTIIQGVNIINETTELNLTIPLTENSILIKFEAKKDDEIVVSKVFKKEKAEEKYNDSIAQGNNAFMSELSFNCESVDVYMGNLNPNQEFELKVICSQLNYTYDKSICFSYDPAILPNFSRVEFNNNTKVTANLRLSAFINTNSKITRLISQSYKELSIKCSEDLLSASITIPTDLFEENNFNLIEILFRTEKIDKIKIIEEYDAKLDLYSYNINYLLDKYNNVKLNNTKNYNNEINDALDTNSENLYTDIFDSKIINDSPAYFTFLIDQSGSMEGESIKLARESLIVFIKSLPQNSNFDIIGFGTSFKSYFDKIQKYDNKSVENAIKIVKMLEADFDGTNLKLPMEYYYNEGKEIGSRFFQNDKPRHLFILTDGDTSSAEVCLSLAESNSSDVKVHCIGIGNGVSKSFITKMGKYGKGSSNIISNNLDMKKVVISALNKALKPYEKIESIELPDSIKKSLIVNYPISDNFVVCQDDLLCYSFVSKEKISEKDSIIFKLKDQVESKAENIVVVNIKDVEITKVEGNILNKLIAGLFLKSQKNNKFISKEKCENMGLMFQVLSPFTSLFCEIEITEKTELVDLNTINNLNKKLDGKKLYKNDGELKKVTCFLDKSKKDGVVNRSTLIFDIDSTLSQNNVYIDKMCDQSLSKKSNNGFFSRISRAVKSIFSIKSTFSSKKTTTSNNDDEKVNENDQYLQIIDKQGVDGIWSINCSSVITKLVNSKSKKTISSIKKQLSSIKFNNSNISEEDVAMTIAVLLLLEKYFAKYEDELILIKNKSVKTLQSIGVDYTKYSL